MTGAARSWSVAWAVAQQSLWKIRRLPPKLIPALLMPLLMFAAFGGALGALGGTKGFGYYNYTAFVFVFVLYMACLFAGVFTSFDLAADFETGLVNRFMLAAPRRPAIVAGYVVVGLCRAVLGIVVMFAIALATGTPIRAHAEDIVGLLALCLLLNVVATLYGAGVALRLQTTAAGVLILIPTFMALFLSPIFIPRARLTGWLRDASDVNPVTPILEAGRGFLAHDPLKVGLAFGCAGGLVLLFSLFVITGMRKAERGPKESARGTRSARGGGGRGGRRSSGAAELG